MIEQLIPNLALLLGVEPATALLITGVVMTSANLAGRLIPDDAQGVLGVIRKVCKIIGVYAPNRISAGVSVNDVAERVNHEIEEHASQVIPAFPGLLDSGNSVDDIIKSTSTRLRGPDGKFLKGE